MKDIWALLLLNWMYLSIFVGEGEASVLAEHHPVWSMFV